MRPLYLVRPKTLRELWKVRKVNHSVSRKNSYKDKCVSLMAGFPNCQNSGLRKVRRVSLGASGGSEPPHWSPFSLTDLTIFSSLATL
jgi:hypothetical protein